MKRKETRDYVPLPGAELAESAIWPISKPHFTPNFNPPRLPSLSLTASCQATPIPTGSFVMETVGPTARLSGSPTASPSAASTASPTTGEQGGSVTGTLTVSLEKLTGQQKSVRPFFISRRETDVVSHLANVAFKIFLRTRRAYTCLNIKMSFRSGIC